MDGGGNDATNMGTVVAIEFIGDGSLLTGLAGGSMTNVVRDGTLTGDGTVSNPLGVADDSLGSAKFIDGGIQEQDIGDDSISGSLIQANAIDGNHIGPDAISSIHIEDGTILVVDLEFAPRLTGDVVQVVDLATPSTNLTYVLSPDGSGGVLARPDAGVTNNSVYSAAIQPDAIQSSHIGEDAIDGPAMVAQGTLSSSHLDAASRDLFTAATIMQGSGTGSAVHVQSVSPNTASGFGATVLGLNNDGDGTFSTIGGGILNRSGGDNSTVGGGYSNNATGTYATVSGGKSNIASNNAVAAGGTVNHAYGPNSVVSGGAFGLASAEYTTVSGGSQNQASGIYATVGGGKDNEATDDYATVAGGKNNTASENYATVGGGNNNTASGTSAAALAGQNNLADGYMATVFSGYNGAHSSYSFVGGGNNGHAYGDNGVVMAGERSVAKGDNSLVIGSYGMGRLPNSLVLGGGKMVGSAFSPGYQQRVWTEFVSRSQGPTAFLAQVKSQNLNYKVYKYTGGVDILFTNMLFLGKGLAVADSKAGIAAWEFDFVAERDGGTSSILASIITLRYASGVGTNFEFSINADTNLHEVLFQITPTGVSPTNNVIGRVSLDNIELSKLSGAW